MHSIPALAATRSGELESTRAKSSLRVALGKKRPSARAHLSKNSRMSVTRSFTTGRLASGAIWIALPLTTFDTWVRQVQRATPFTVMAQAPHMPTRQAKR